MYRRPILAMLLAAMLGNSGLACACALAALDVPVTMHHAMPGAHTQDASTEHHDDDSCRHSAMATASKASDASDQRADKPLPPAAHSVGPRQLLVPGLASPWQYEKRYRTLPLSTPVSRGDTLLD